VKVYQRVLAIGAHTDDLELGCGALLSRLRREGCTVMTAAFSRAEASLPPELPRDTLEREYREAMRRLGVPDENVYMGDVPVRHFPEHRQRILEELVRMAREYDPDLVLTMNSQDSHQDHRTVHEESVRAFRGRTVLGYEIPWNQQQNIVNLFVEVTEDDVAAKTELLAAYDSQVQLGRPYVDPEYVRSAATFRGYQSRRRFAEAYEIVTMTWDA